MQFTLYRKRKMDDETQTDGDTNVAPEEVQRQARDMGWQPREQWKGNPDNWVDAGEFVKRGETFVPFLQHERKRLKTDLEQRDARLVALQEELRQARESVEAVKTFNAEMARERTERRKV